MITEYCGLLGTVKSTPSSTLKSSIKLESLRSVRLFLTKVVCILNLSAPGAAKLVKPFALSYKVLSCFAFTISSLIWRPTLYEGESSASSRTTVCFLTSTK